MENIKNLKVNIENKILSSDNVVIVPHNGVDFDAIGSAIGLSLIAKKLKKSSCIIVDDPIYKIDHGVQIIMDEAKKDFTIINREKYLQSKTKEFTKELFILTDVNKSYLISMKDDLPEKEQIIIIDHHDEDAATVCADVKYIDPKISSASEIVAKLLGLCKIKITPEVANYLLAGIYLDTNKLMKNATPETMKLIAKLLENGANMNTVTDLFAEDFISDRRIQELVSKAKISTYSIATVCADEKDEYTREELAKVADYLLKYKVDAAFAIGNIGENVISISARSKERVNVGAVMQSLEGGGNQYSGATKLTDCTIEEAGKKLLKVIQPPCYIK